MSTHNLAKNLAILQWTTYNSVPFLPSQLLLDPEETILAENVPHLEKKSYYKQSYSGVSTDGHVRACLKLQHFNYIQKRHCQDLRNLFLDREV